MYNLYSGLVDNGNNFHVLAMNTFKQYCDISTVPKEFREKSNYTLVDVDIRIRAIPAFYNLFTNQSYNIKRFDSENFKRVLLQILQKYNYDIVILESLYTAPYIELLKEKTKAKLVLRAHNVEFKIWENLANNEKFLLKKWYLNLLSHRLKKYELKTLTKVDLIASISNEDNIVFQKETCQTPMIYLPFGINFRNEEFKNYTYPEVDELVLFHIGSMDWLPHQESFKWFLNEVWRNINTKYPFLKLYLAGTKMPNWITHGSYPNLIVTSDYVDGKIFMNKKAIMIVPSFSGSGIRIKIVEGMALGKVIITTANGAMGIPCSNGKNIFISDNSNEWVEVIGRCVNDIELVKNVSKKARLFAEAEFDHKLSAKKLIEALTHYN
jgi:glycosyltransferase involved in cell wall biosynthesis